MSVGALTFKLFSSFLFLSRLSLLNCLVSLGVSLILSFGYSLFLTSIYFGWLLILVSFSLMMAVIFLCLLELGWMSSRILLELDN